MLQILYSSIEQVIRPGRGFQLAFMVTVGILCYLSYYLGKRGKTWEIRPLEGLEAAYEGIGRAAEMGRPVMMLPGISDLGNPQTLAGLTVLGEIAQRGAEIGVPTVTSASHSAVVSAAEAIIRSAYAAAGKPELYMPGKYVRWFGWDQFAYAVGAAGHILEEKPAMIIYLGYFLFDTIVDAETGSRVGAIQIGGTIGSLDMIAQFCDYILIGEEIYAAAASITKDKLAISTIAGQDWIKLITVGIMVLGVITMALGSKYILDLLGA
ncbi:MAG: DUF6754 domain-containing protein [Candidatus Bathyarchaeia archaeon]|nr:hypothetical protein [Candidatus Bathyarchaeota archaeon]